MRTNLAGLSLRDLQYAAAVAETRHFGRAAERCGVSQAALSEQLRKLEALLGGKLFERGHRRVAPTDRGAALLRQIDAVLAQAYGLLDMAHDDAGLLSGPLRLGAIATLGPYYLPHLLRQVRGAFPSVDLRLTEGQTAGLLDQLRRGELDAVLLALPTEARWAVAESLFFEPFRLVCPVGHKLAGQAEPRLAELAGPGLILLADGHCLRDQALSLCGSTRGEGRHATSVETLWHMIAAGEGYSLLPALSTGGRGTMAGLVACRDMAEPEAGRMIGLAWRGTDPRDALLRGFAEALRAQPPDGVAPLDVQPVAA
jgi:LysR family hydrogen peroxide-inducible transcriptional activator